MHSTVSWTWELSLPVEIPCQNTFKDKPAFIKRLIKVLVGRNLFSVHSSSCKQLTHLKATTCDLRFHLWIYYNAWSNLTQEIQFLEFMGGSNLPLASSPGRFFANITAGEKYSLVLIVYGRVSCDRKFNSKTCRKTIISTVYFSCQIRPISMKPSM